MKTKKIDRMVLTVAVVGSLVLANIVGVSLWGRLDLTRDHEFTLSQATLSTLHGLSEPVIVRAYFTKDLPARYARVSRYVRDLLDEYYSASGGQLRYEFIDPQSEETAADKEKKKEVKNDIFGRPVREMTSVERELQSLGIQRVNMPGGGDNKLEVVTGYMGIAIKYGEKSEVIPQVAQTEGLEYELTTRIKKLARDKTPKVAVVTRLAGQELQREYGQMLGMLSQLYSVEPVDLQGGAQIPEDADALVVLAPQEPFSEDQVQKLDAFVMSGRSAAFLLDVTKPDMQTASAPEIKHGLEGLLNGYGVEVGDGLVLDAKCIMMTVGQQQASGQVVLHQVQYPLIPLVQGLDPKHPLTQGLERIAFPYMSPVRLKLPEGSAVKGDVLVRSSSKSWVQKPPYNINPLQEWNVEGLGEAAAEPLLVTLQGPLKSQAVPDNLSASPPEGGANARVLVAGGASFVSDRYERLMGRSQQAFLLNLFDWLLLDDGLLAVRSRGLSAAPLDDISDGARQVVKYLNIAALPLGFAGLGLVRWRLREARRNKVSL